MFISIFYLVLDPGRSSPAKFSINTHYADTKQFTEFFLVNKEQAAAGAFKEKYPNYVISPDFSITF